MNKQHIIATVAACAAIHNAIALPEGKPPSTPDEALAELRAGNERFQNGVAERRDLLEEAKDTSGGQKPFAAIVSCIDSRTSTELIFDQGIGDVFNARLAGNVVDEDVLGSLEFATKVAGAKLVAVIGHSGCGAVVGAIDKVELGNLTGLLDRIEPAVARAAKEQKGDDTAKNPEFVNACIEENVRWQVKQLTEKSPILKELADKGQIRIVGGVHDLASGKVQFLADAD
ncbi:MAG: carbonic anhydrase [Chthoniobacterales bacterium]|nr:carbonic anhydrase [Chthoniobacterales bacterium]